MTDLELAEFLGFASDKRWPKIIADLKSEKRAIYERMAEVETELHLWEAGLGPLPSGVIVCHDHKRPKKRTRA